MRVLLVSGSLPPDVCGVGDYTHSLANALATIPGNEIAVLTSATDAIGPDLTGRKYEVLRPVRRWNVTEARIAFSAIKAWQPDIVHVQHPTQGYGNGWLPSLIELIATFVGARTVRTWHEGFTKRQAFRLIAQSITGGPYIVVRPDFDRYVSRLLRPLVKRRHRTLVLSTSAIPRSLLAGESLAKHRAEIIEDAMRLIVFFGFIHPKKGIERIFDAANPVTDKIVIAGQDQVDPEYTALIASIVDSPAWRGRAKMLGVLPADKVADLLAVADVVALPFVDGGGIWNSSIHAAVNQGTAVITTTVEEAPLSAEGLVQYVRAGDAQALQRAFNTLPRWNAKPSHVEADGWARVAREHQQVYLRIL